MVRKRRRWTETGRGQKGSIFVASDGCIVRAKRVGRTVGGYQIWELEVIPMKGRRYKKRVHLKRRTELREALKYV